MKAKEKLVAELEGKIPKKYLHKLPSRYPIIGNALVIRLEKDLLPYGKLIGEALIKIFPKVKGVWAITTTRKIIREPQTIFLAGTRDPIVLHREFNTYFKVDVERLTFSPGNRGERKRLLELVDEAQIIVDMFACVGNLSLPIAVNTDVGCIYAIEINPYAFKFLAENILLNNVQGKVIPILGNNARFDKRDIADHVLLGFLPKPTSEQLLIALKVVGDGGIIHYHTLVRKGAEKSKLAELMKHIKEFGFDPSLFEYRVVKSFSPALNHVVYRVRINK